MIFHLILPIFLILKLSLCDIEYTPAIQDEHPTIASDFSINKEYFNCTNGAEKLWHYFKDEIDLNRDDLVDRPEIENYLIKIIRNNRNEEANFLTKKLDVNKTGFVVFDVYANETFGGSLFELLAKDSAGDDDLRELKILYNLEKNKWLNFSSSEKNLNYSQFYEFLFTDESEKLIEIEKEITFRTYDTNGDGYLSLEEFSIAIKNLDETLVEELGDKKSSKRIFTRLIDLNGDNQLDKNEFKKWFILTSKEKLIDDEKSYLFDCCDENMDSFLDKLEIERNCGKLVKSHLIVNDVTLDDTSRNYLSAHDEF